MSDNQRIKVLALVRDMGAGNVVASVVQALHEQGHHTLLLVEDGGQAKNKLTVPFTIVHDVAELAHLVVEASPQVIITGLSSPRYLESWLDEYAIRSAIPLVNIEDYWGTVHRSPVTATLVITVDEAAKRLVLASKPKLKDAQVFVVGFAGILPLEPRLWRALLAMTFNEYRQRGAKILVYTDSGPGAEESLPTLVESVLQTTGPIVLIPKFHPKDKMVLHPSGGTWGDWCERQIELLRRAGLVADFAEPADDLVELADATFSDYSTLLMRAAKVGKVAVTLWNAPVQRSLKKEAGLDETPLMMRGGYPVITKPQPLDDLLAGKPPVLDLKVFDARLAAERIVALVT